MSFAPADFWPPGPPTGGAALDQVARDAAAAAQATANAAINTGAELQALVTGDPAAATAVTTVPFVPAGATTRYPRSSATRAQDQVWVGDHCAGDGSDETAGLLEAIARLPLATGGYVHVDRAVTFATGIDIDRPVHFVGEGSSRFNNSYRPRSRLIYSGTGPYAFNLGFATVPAARGSGFKDINLEYNNTGFTGDLIQNHVLGLGCYNSVLMGINSSNVPIYTARALVALGNAHSYIFESCHFDYAQRGIYVYDDGGGAPNHLRAIACHFDNLVEAGISQDPTLGAIFGAYIAGCVFNPIVLSRTHAQGQPRIGCHIKALGFFIGGCNFLPSNFDVNAWADCGLKIDAGRGVVTGCKFGNSSTGIRVLSGHAIIEGNYFDGTCPIQAEGGALQTKGNVIGAFYGHPWVALENHKKGDRVIPTTPNGLSYRAGNDGTSGASQPTWPTSTGLTVVDGTITWNAEHTAGILGVTTAEGVGSPHLEAQGDEFGSGFSYSVFSSGQTPNGWVRPYTDPGVNGVRGDQGLEVIPNNPKAAAKAANYAVLNKDGSTISLFTNKSATGSITFTLPDQSSNRTIEEFEFVCYEAQPIVVQRGGATNVILGPAGAVNSLTSPAVIGSRIKLKYDHAFSTTGGWRITGMVGAWT